MNLLKTFHIPKGISCWDGITVEVQAFSLLATLCIRMRIWALTVPGCISVATALQSIEGDFSGGSQNQNPVLNPVLLPSCVTLSKWFTFAHFIFMRCCQKWRMKFISSLLNFCSGPETLVLTSLHVLLALRHLWGNTREVSGKFRKNYHSLSSARSKLVHRIIENKDIFYSSMP